MRRRYEYKSISALSLASGGFFVAPCCRLFARWRRFKRHSGIPVAFVCPKCAQGILLRFITELSNFHVHAFPVAYVAEQSYHEVPEGE